MLGFGEDGEGKAQMPCGHVISTEGMTLFLQSLITAQKYKIICPGKNAQNLPCNTEWEFTTCIKVGQLSQTEKKEFEIGLGR